MFEMMDEDELVPVDTGQIHDPTAVAEPGEKVTLDPVHVAV